MTTTLDFETETAEDEYLFADGKPRVRVRSTYVEGANMRGLLNTAFKPVAVLCEGGHLFEVFSDGAVGVHPFANIVGDKTEKLLRMYAENFKVPVMSAIYRYQNFKGTKRKTLTRRPGVITFRPDGSSELFWGFGPFSGKEDNDTSYRMV